MMDRILYLDGIPLNRRFNRIVVIDAREDVDDLYMQYYHLLDPPTLTLDCRTLGVRKLTLLLKFLEEYKGGVTMIAIDPVPGPILSRFSVIEKYPQEQSGSLMGIRFRNLPRSIKTKVFTMFNIAVPEEQNG